MRKNQLLINNGDLTFSDQTEKYGLGDISYSVEAAFFDYDIDGDLDMFLVNTPVDFSLISTIFHIDSMRADRELFEDYMAADKLYRNDGENGFQDVTIEAGIVNDIGFGLSVSIADYNNDHLPDFFVSNDFNTPDLLHINQGNGTFREESKSFFKHTSFYSMGSDAADVNNDNQIDLVVVDMLPEDYIRSKTSMTMTSIDAFNTFLSYGFNYQYMQNMFHLNNGNSTFSDLGQMAGINKSDWSWSPLLADFDNDGWKDLFVSNGIKRDVTDKDYPIKLREYRSKYGDDFSMLDGLNLMP